MIMIDLNELTHDLTSAATNLVRAKSELFDASEAVISAKIALDDAESELTAQGVEGKNAEERKANLRNLTESYRGRLEVAEEKERLYRYNLDVAQIGYDVIRYRLRIAEIMSKETA
jgi:predicted  nucleic acid-binding Zn-ribbon protein